MGVLDDGQGHAAEQDDEAGDENHQGDREREQQGRGGVPAPVAFEIAGRQFGCGFEGPAQPKE